MKAIMISIRPQHVANILNGIKTIEIRKRFPKDYVGWVYIYCTKNGNDCYGMPTDLVDYRGCAIYNKFKLMPKGEKVTTDDNQPRLNGKVVARFWCDKVEEILARKNTKWYHLADTVPMCDGDIYHICQKSCLSQDELHNYLKSKRGRAIHITKLEIFDKPKELSEFSIKVFPHRKDNLMTRYLTRAPQSWCYVEI